MSRQLMFAVTLTGIGLVGVGVWAVRRERVPATAALASAAIGFAPADADRAAILRAIGRGIGRTVAHEFAHQVIGAREIHSRGDRSSYEYPDVRVEHFYGELHWTTAATLLQSRLGRCG